ncbi:MAG: hypothetical protein U1E37_05985 [Sphingomonadaceae bacterium]
MTMPARPASARLLAVLLLILALLIGYVGLSANGYLVPAVAALAMAALLWFGKARRLFKAVTLVNLVSGSLLVLVLAFGDFLGDRKLDVSGVSLLVNLVTGGPAVALIAPALLLGLRRGKPLHAWFEQAAAAA